MKAFFYILISLLLAACGASNSPIIITNSCAIDVPAEKAIHSTAQELHVGGWAFDRRLNTSPEKVNIQITSIDHKVIKIYAAMRGTKRPDVVKALNATGAELSGFNVLVPPNELVSGDYEIVVLQDLPNGTLVCSNMRELKVK